MKWFGLLIALSISGALAAAPLSPYVDEKDNPIKALSPAQVSALLEGHGMGFALAAELNRYPGPRHVLELSEPLQLSERQLTRTRQVFESMRSQAVRLGTELVEQERELDQLFSSQQASPSALDTLLSRIGETRARLRGIHLHAHLQMKQVLTRHQVSLYQNLRGYTDQSHQHEHGHAHQH